MRQHFFFYAILIVFLAVFSTPGQTVRIVKTPPQRLINFLYQTDEGKEDLRKNYAGDLKSAARDLLIKAVDINHNGTPEYFISRKSVCRNADCPVTLYQQKGGTFVRLLTAPRLDVSAGYSEGWRNLVACESASAQPRCSFYRWYKKEYVRYRCVEAKTKESGLKAKDIPCSELN